MSMHFNHRVITEVQCFQSSQGSKCRNNKKICWCFLQKLGLAVYLLRFCQIKLSTNKTRITCIPCIIYYWNPVFCYHWLSSVKVQAKFAFVHSKRAECTSFLYAYLLRLRQTKQIWIKMYFKQGYTKES